MLLPGNREVDDYFSMGGCAMKKGKALRSYIMAALHRVGLLSADKETNDIFNRLVRGVVDTRKEVKNKYQGQVPHNALDNIAILKIAFGLTNPEIGRIICGDLSQIEKTIRIREREIALLATAYARAKSHFPHLKDALTSGKAFEEIDLRSLLALGQFGPDDQHSKPGIPLHMAKALERVRWSDGFQDGDPDAICLAAEKYMAAGAIEIAEPLIEQVLEAAPDHPGGWFQKARLLLKKSAQAMRQASLYSAMSEAADTLSAGERHYDELAHDEAGTSQDLRRQAFDVCVKAYSLLPDGKEYEPAAIRWSIDYGTLRALRVSVLTFIVEEAGDRSNPYHWETGLRERIDARLGRTRKLVFHPGKEGTGPSREWVADPDEMARLSALPLFSETTDKVIVAAYKELMASHWPAIENRTYLRLSALNFLRLLVAQEDYRREVSEFVESIKTGYAPSSGAYFGPFSDPDEPLTCWRLVLHEHLDAVMDRAEQRSLVRSVYAGWISNINQRRDEALTSIYDDEIRLRFAAGDDHGAHEVACLAEADGIYRREDGYGALILRRTAQRAARSLGANVTEAPSVAGHLQDESMKTVAEEYYEALLSEWDVIEGPDPFPDYLWAIENELQDE